MEEQQTAPVPESTTGPLANFPIAVGNFQLQSQLAGQSGQGLSVSGYIYDDDNETKLNDRLDMYKRVIDRQQKISEIPLLEAKLQGLREAQKQNETLFNEFLEKQNRGEKMPSTEKQNGNNLRVNIRHFQDQIKLGEESIKRLKSEVG
jgi:hypothetical protein